MRVSDIQDVVLAAMAHLGIQMMQSTQVALSCEPDDPNYDRTVKRNTFVFGALMTKNQFFTFREICNAGGVWINRPTFWQFGEDDTLFEYSMSAVEKWS
jgi:hypothetical protein